jgi:predicted nucleic acid-binding protein
MIYLDASYIIKCYLLELGTPEVLTLVQGNAGCSSALHGRVEFWSGVHRRFREKSISDRQAREVWQQFEQDERSGVWRWLPLTQSIVKRACEAFEKLAPNVFLRSGDALHLACAGENGFVDVYSADRVLLTTASHFGLNGISVY